MIHPITTEADHSGGQLTAVVILEDFPLVAHKGPEGCPASYWAFSYGINATFQYPLQSDLSANLLINTPIETEFDSSNGEGIDAFTVHGISKQQLILSVYSSEKAAPYWMRSAKKIKGSGLFACMTSRISALWSKDPVTIMQWYFHQTNKVSLTGEVNTLVHPSGARLNLVIETEDPIEK